MGVSEISHSVFYAHSFEPKHWICFTRLLLLRLQPVFISVTHVYHSVRLVNDRQKLLLSVFLHTKSSPENIQQKQRVMCVNHKLQAMNRKEKRVFFIFTWRFQWKLAESDPNITSKYLLKPTPTSREWMGIHTLNHRSHGVARLLLYRCWFFNFWFWRF